MRAATNRPQPPSPGKGGFSLLEVILAIAVAAALLAAATSFITSVSNIWLGRQDRAYFQDHVDGVTEFLNAAFRQSGTSIASGNPEPDADEAPTDNAEPDETATPEVGAEAGKPEETAPKASSGKTLIRVAEKPVDWARPPGYPDYEDPLLTMQLMTPPPLLLAGSDTVNSSIQAYLHFEKGIGLSILWYSSLQEEQASIDDLQRSLISPHIIQIDYIYWDERFEQWDFEDAPRRDNQGATENFLLPRYLQLHFEHEGVRMQRKLSIPIPNKHALLF